ncbi:MAG: cytochrome o ubiquinol oxidase subunit I, partial [Paracoccus marcusii]
MATIDHSTTFLLGRLNLSAIPQDPIVWATFVVVAIGGAGLMAVLTKYRLWGYLWHEWFTTVDHKKIGIMYMVLALIMLLRGFADAVMMRLQSMLAFNGSEGY